MKDCISGNCQDPACVYKWEPKCLKECGDGDLDLIYSFAGGIYTATVGVLTHCGLAVPKGSNIDIAPAIIPQVGKGGCGCQGIAVGIGLASNVVQYDNCTAKEMYTTYEVRVYQCRPQNTQESGRPSVGGLSGADVDTMAGTTLETTRYYMALRRYLIKALSGLTGCKKTIDCSTIKDVTYSFAKQGKCNYVSAKFKVKI